MKYWAYFLAKYFLGLHLPELLNTAMIIIGVAAGIGVHDEDRLRHAPAPPFGGRGSTGAGVASTMSVVMVAAPFSQSA